MQSKEAYNLGVRMFRNDEWLKNSLKGANAAADNGGKEGLMLVVRELARDDHFQLNWWPIILKMAGTEKAAHELLFHVWSGFSDAFLDAHFQGPENEDPLDSVFDPIKDFTNRKRR